MTTKTTRLFALAAIGGLALASTPLAAQSSQWNKKVTSLVADNFSYPRSAVVRGDEGRATVKVEVAPNGQVTAVTLAKSSGSRILDREAVRIVRKIGSLPSPPAGTKSISLPIEFKLKS